MSVSTIGAALPEILNGILTPAMLLGCGLILSLEIGIHRLLKPAVFCRTLTDIPPNSKTTPIKAVSTALAGTLGVGNITGVSTAILQGGAGAVFWMWVGAVFSMAVKYGEVALAVHWRHIAADGTYEGGAMYTIRDGLAQRLGIYKSTLFGGVFAVLCLANALITGTIVQANTAAAVCSPFPKWLCGIFLAILVLAASAYGIRRVGDITVRLIPLLTILYIILSFGVILTNISLLPEIFSRIFKEAFALRSLGGGITGLSIREAIRFGITRGIFSNEAGCGTSPTAHAAADTKSPHHQGIYGIFEVICDTIVLCSLTAFVILIADSRFGILASGSALTTLEAYALFGGMTAYRILGFSVVLFAYSSILAQLYYGITALRYFTESVPLRRGYILLTILCTAVGAVISPALMWNMADWIVGVMTCLNTAVLWLLRRQIHEISENK